jgi:hypothetical protein
MAISRLRSRLRKLEGRFTDESGLRPRSQEWLAHWARRMQRIFSGEELGTPGCIPLEVWDGIDVADRSERKSERAPADNLAQMTAVIGPQGEAGIATDNA